MRSELEDIYRKHRQPLFSVALTVTGCTELAEDAVHEAFARLCQKSERPAGGLVPYVFASVRNAAVDVVRGQKQQEKLAASLFVHLNSSGVAENSTGENLQSRADQEQDLKAAIDGMDEQTRQIIVMKVYAELTFEEIGEVLASPAATVATRYRRAILKLEEQMRKRS